MADPVDVSGHQPLPDYGVEDGLGLEGQLVEGAGEALESAAPAPDDFLDAEGGGKVGGFELEGLGGEERDVVTALGQGRGEVVGVVQEAATAEGLDFKDPHQRLEMRAREVEREGLGTES